METVEIIQQAEAPAAIGDRLKALPGVLSSQALEKAVAEFRAATDLLSGLVTYEAAIWEPIGLRSQARLNSDQATEVASCLLVRRDVSLNL